MDLSGGSLYWPATSPEPAGAKSLRGSARCDVLVVGAGITGALAAYTLSRIGARVIVVDRRAPVSGSTPASTALVQYEIDSPLTTLTQKLGPEHARAAYLAAARAVGDLHRLAGELDSECELAPRPSLYLAAAPHDTDMLQKEAAARREIGLAATYLDRDRLLERFSLDRPGAILSELALEVNPVKLTRALLAAAARRGTRVFDRTEVDLSGVRRATTPFELPASGGASIQTDWVVLATGYETPEQFNAVAELTHLKSTYAVATSPLQREPWPERALLWEHAEPYFYARSTADGRVLIGGEDTDFVNPRSRDALIDAKSETLGAKLKMLVPSIHATLQMRWAAAFAQTDDGLPYIGRHSQWSNALFALGYGGNGITFSVIAAQIIAGVVSGRSHDDARWFSFDR